MPKSIKTDREEVMEMVNDQYQERKESDSPEEFICIKADFTSCQKEAKKLQSGEPLKSSVETVDIQYDELVERDF